MALKTEATRKEKRLERHIQILESRIEELQKENEELLAQISVYEDIKADIEAKQKQMDAYVDEFEMKVHTLDELKDKYEDAISTYRDFVRKEKKKFIKETNKAIKEFKDTLLNS